MPEREQVTILFCDLVGSTALLARIGEAANDELRRDLFAAMREPVTAFRGREVKSQGDGLMVAFPAASAGSARAADPLRCAVAMQQAVARLDHRDPLLGLAIRIGVSTGEATNEDDDWFGTPVVEAARLCSTAQPGQILATAATATHSTADDVPTEALGTTELKGFPEPVPVAEVGWARDEPTPAVPLHPALVFSGGFALAGRRDEMAELDAAWRGVDAGGPGCVLLRGVSGAGKTRLIAELARDAAVDGAIVLYGSCRRDAGPLGPLLEGLRWCAAASTAEQVRTLLGDQREVLAPQASWVRHRVPQASASDEQREPEREAGPDVDEPVDAVVSVLRRLAGSPPIMVVIDDVQDASPAMLTALARLVTGEPVAGALVVVAGRTDAPRDVSEVLDKLAAVDGTVTLELGSLPADDVHALVADALPALDRDALHDVQQAVLDQTGGVAGQVVEALLGVRDELAVTGVDVAARRGEALTRRTREALARACPYRGLLAFTEADRDLFFGRDEATAGILARLSRSRFVAVIGASGSGKSSVLRAGVLPALERGALPRLGRCRTVTVQPGARPAEALERALAGAGAAGDESPLVLFVDQFEEAFTLCHDLDERRRFIDRLLTAPLDPTAAISVVLAVRADFVGLCAADPALAAALEVSDMFLGPMAADDLRLAVEGPARAAGLRLEPGLVDVVLADVDQQPGALPLVSHALLETWRRRDDRTLTLAGYREAGGVHGAIARTADEIYVERFDGAEQAVARTIFLRLTELGEGTEDTRRRVDRAEIDGLAGNDPTAVAHVVQVLADARLIIVDEGTIEVAHEALIREWPRLRGWLDDDRDGLRLHRHVTEASREWERLGRPDSELYRGTRLEEARSWIEQSAPALTESERAFLDASDDRQRAEEAAEVEAAVAQVRANRRLKGLLTATAIGLVLTLAAGVVAITQRNRADEEAGRAGEQAVVATAGRLAARSAALAESDPSAAVLLALESVRLDDTPDNRAALAAAIASRPALTAVLPPSTGTRYHATAFRPRANEVAAAADGAIDRWDTFTFEAIGEPLAVEARDVAYSPDGAQLAAATGAGVEVFDLVDGEAPVSVGTIEVEGGADGVAWSPDGATLAVGRADQEALFVSVADGQVVGPISPGFVGAVVAFSPEGTSVAVGGEADAQVFDVATGQPLLAPLAAGAAGIGIGGASVSFDKIEDTVAFGRRDGSATEFDLASGTPVGGSGGEVGVAVAIGPGVEGDGGEASDEQSVVVAGEDAAAPAQVFHVAADLWESSLTGNLVPNLASASFSTTFGAGQPSEYRPSVGAVADIAVSVDEQMVAVAGDGLALLDLGGADASARQVFVGEASDPWTAVGEPVLVPSALAGGFRPDGTVAVASFAQTLEVDVDVRTLAVDLVTGRAVAPPLSGVAQYVDLERLLRGNAVDAGVSLDTVTINGEELTAPEDAGVVGIPLFAYDEARTALALTSADGTVRVFTGDGDKLTGTTVPVTDGPIVAIAVSRDGELLAVTTGTEDRVLSIYDVASGEPMLGGLALGALLVEPVAFNADGSLLAVARGDGTVLVLDPTTGQPQADPIATGDGVLTLAFSPDGSELAVGRTWLDDVGSTVARWTLEGDEVSAPLPLGRDDPAWLAYDPNGGRLLVGVTGGDVLLWSFDRTMLEEAACRVAGRNLTQEEWARELPGEDYRESCAGYGSG